MFGVVALLLLLAVPAFALVWSLSGSKGTRAKEAISVQGEPVQTMLPADPDAETTPIAGRNLFVSWKMTPRATFRMAGRVVGIMTYDDWQSAFVPLDLCLAWGDLGDPASSVPTRKSIASSSRRAFCPAPPPASRQIGRSP